MGKRNRGAVKSLSQTQGVRVDQIVSHSSEVAVGVFWLLQLDNQVASWSLVLLIAHSVISQLSVTRHAWLNFDDLLFTHLGNRPAIWMDFIPCKVNCSDRAIVKLGKTDLQSDLYVLWAGWQRLVLSLGCVSQNRAVQVQTVEVKVVVIKMSNLYELFVNFNRVTLVVVALNVLACMTCNSIFKAILPVFVKECLFLWVTQHIIRFTNHMEHFFTGALTGHVRVGIKLRCQSLERIVDLLTV